MPKPQRNPELGEYRQRNTYVAGKAVSMHNSTQNRRRQMISLITFSPMVRVLGWDMGELSSGPPDELGLKKCGRSLFR